MRGIRETGQNLCSGDVFIGSLQVSIGSCSVNHQLDDGRVSNSPPYSVFLAFSGFLSQPIFTRRSCVILPFKPIQGSTIENTKLIRYYHRHWNVERPILRQEKPLQDLKQSCFVLLLLHGLPC